MAKASPLQQPFISTRSTTAEKQFLGFMPHGARQLVLWPIYAGCLAAFAGVLLLAVFPFCIALAVLYFLITQAKAWVGLGSNDFYVEEANLKKMQIGVISRWLTLNRSVMVIAFVAPISLALNVYTAFRDNYRCLCGMSPPGAHEARVKLVQDQVKSWCASGKKQRMSTSRPGWQRMSTKFSEYKKNCFLVDLFPLNNIVEIDAASCSVTCEPMVSMGQLSRVLAADGWTLAIVPELEALTVGGMVAGTGIETSSHHQGLFQNICISLEVILATGEIVECSRTTRPELFEAFFWSYGTLGLLVSAKMRIEAAAPFVRLEYHCFETETGFCDFWRQESNRGLVRATKEAQTEADGVSNAVSGDSTDCHQFVEGLMFSQSRGVVMTGDYAAEVGADGTLYRHGLWYQPYFYKHVDAMFARMQSKDGVRMPIVEYLPALDYYHRHSRSIFWEMENIMPMGDTALFRFLLGWMMPLAVGFLKGSQPAEITELYQTRHVVQDMIVPGEKLEPAFATMHDNFGIYPLWVCPTMVGPGAGLLHAPPAEPGMPHGGRRIFADIGAYGVPIKAKRGEEFDVVKAIRDVEAEVVKCGGWEMLYAESYLTREEFGLMFDRRLYDKLRTELGAVDAFPDVYDKVVESKRQEQLRDWLGCDVTSEEKK